MYRKEATPVEDFYREHKLLLDFEITQGIPETMPVILKVLEPYMKGRATAAAPASAQAAAALEEARAAQVGGA